MDLEQRAWIPAPRAHRGRALGTAAVGSVRLLMIAFAILSVAVPGAPAPPASERPLVLALVLDTSGSLGPKDVALRTQLARGVLKGLPAGSEVVLFAFDDKPRLVQPRTAELDGLAKAVGRLSRAGRFTALYDAIHDASRYLDEGPGARKAILVVTDGLDENSALLLTDAARTAREAGIPVFALGVGRVQERVLRRIAKLTGGEYFVARGARAAPIASRIAALAPEVRKPAPSAAALTAPPVSPASAPAPSPPPPAAEPRPSLGLLAVLGVPAVLVVAVLVGAVVMLLRRGRAPAAEPAESEQDVEDATTEVMPLPSDEPGPTTMVLALRPLLHVTRGSEPGRIYSVSFDSATSVGRSKVNHVVLEDHSVSAQHFRIRPREGKFELIDLKSTNGTFVNERRVGRHPLVAGDVIKVGQTVLQFRMDHQAGI